MELSDAHVLLVGATGGLGAALARSLAGAGARLTLVGRDADVLRSLTDSLGESVVVASTTVDLVDPTAPEVAVRTAVEAAGPLQGVVYAAGVVAFGPVAELDDDVLDQLLLIDLIAPVRLARAATPHVQPGGVLVHVSAVVAEQPLAGMAAYSAVKAGLTAFDAALARELRRQRIRVLDVRPPHTETGLVTRALAGAAPRLPQGQQPAEVADRIVRAIVDDETDLPADAFTAS